MQLRFTPQNVAYLLSSISLGTTVSNTQEKLETLVMQKFVQKAAVGRYTCTLGDKLQQHVAATDHSMCTGRATSCSNKVRRHVATTNSFVCTGEFLWKSLSPKQNFVAATSRKKSSQTEFVRLVAATSVAYTRSDSRSLQRVASTYMLLQLVAWCVPTLRVCNNSFFEK